MRKIFLTLLVAIAFVFNATAQDRIITGRISDDKGNPVAGVSVSSSDGRRGTQTDQNGNYRISVPPGTANLTFSSVNFQSRTMAVRGTEMDVVLASDEKQLEEIIVVGYGTQQKRTFTGSSSKIETKEFAQLITPSIDKQLAGRASGVNVINNSGTVNAPARIRIRGIGSLSGNRDPLIIVDGVPLNTGNLSIIGNSNALGDINPSDIESIDVLKDGSATAIYGSRAANGIIQITTKRGSRSRSSVTYDASFGMNNPLQRFSLLDQNQFVTIANEKLTNAGTLPAARLNPNGGTDWQDFVFAKNSFTQSHTLGVTGGSDKTNTYFSFNYGTNQGIVITNQNRAIRVRANIEHQATKWLKIGNLLTLSRQKDNDQNNGSNALSGSIVGAVRALPNVEFSILQILPALISRLSRQISSLRE